MRKKMDEMYCKKILALNSERRDIVRLIKKLDTLDLPVFREDGKNAELERVGNRNLDFNLYGWPMEASCMLAAELEELFDVTFSKPEMPTESSMTYLCKDKIYGFDFRIYNLNIQGCVMEVLEWNEPSTYRTPKKFKIKCS
jgi:hypothetical protein